MSDTPEVIRTLDDLCAGAVRFVNTAPPAALLEVLGPQNGALVLASRELKDSPAPLSQSAVPPAHGTEIDEAWIAQSGKAQEHIATLFGILQYADVGEIKLTTLESDAIRWAIRELIPTHPKVEQSTGLSAHAPTSEE